MGKGALPVKAVKFVLVIFSFLAPCFGDIKFSASTNHTNVVPGEQVIVIAELVSDKPLKGTSVPPVASNDAFDVVRTEQNQSSNSSVQIINGKMMQSEEIHYQFYYVLVPKKTGPFAFPALQVTIGNAPYATEPISFNVGAEPVKNPNVRVLLTLSKQPLYVGEQAILTFKVARRGNAQIQIERGFNAAVSGIEKSFGKGYSLSRLFTNQVTQASERIGGEMYATYSLRWALIPLSAGQMVVPAISYEYAELRQVRRRGMDPFFDDFFGNSVQEEPHTAFSSELALHIKELPPPPAGFSGAVGRCTLTASIEPSSIPAGEAATLKIMLSAATRPGNVAELTIPKIANCEFFTPEKHVDVDTTAAGISTRKSYKYLLIPQQKGALAIPPIELSYFDPYEGVYKKTSSGTLSLEVTPGKGGAKPQTRYLTQEEIHEVGTDIRYIKTEVALRNVSEKPYRDPIFFLLYPLPFALFLFALLYRVQSQRREANAASYVRKKALGSAYKALDALRKQGSKVPTPQFLGTVAETMERYISRKFGFAATGRTLEELKAELLSRDADGQIVSELTSFIELLDSYRFGGAAFDEHSRLAVLNQAITFLASLEKSAKKGKKSMSAPAMIVSVLSVILIGASSASSAPTGLWLEQANRFYTAQQYDSAAAYYEKIVSSGVTAGAVYFNLGNAYYRLKKLGLSRLCYEKAARLDPADPDIAANIKFVSSNIVDRITEPQRGFVEAVLWRLHVLMPLRVQLWFCFSLLFVISLLAAAALFVKGNRRLWLIYVSTLLGIVVFFSSLSMGLKIFDAEHSAYAILLDPSIDAKNEPEGAKILFTIHEGTKLQIRKSVEGWSLVSLPNGVSGWVENKTLGRI
jgi:tetratricopeptide (TPR) repeat protein